MPNLALTAAVSRVALGLPDLDINDHLTYYLAPQLLGGQVTYNRVTATSPFVDGARTVVRTRQVVNEQVAVEVLAQDSPGLQTAMAALLDAFTQDRFTLTLTVDGATYGYQCEAADYQVSWAGPRFIARQGQVVFTVPRQPVPTSGGV